MDMKLSKKQVRSSESSWIDCIATKKQETDWAAEVSKFSIQQQFQYLQIRTNRRWALKSVQSPKSTYFLMLTIDVAMKNK